LKSSAYESELLEKNGFTISDRGIGGLGTSWIATWGSGSPVLGILVEFDALPELRNDTEPRQVPAKSGNSNGHGCGVVRDVLTNSEPMILCGQPYATAALLGSLVTPA
jgi:metal-dependent amidase/aminoacylase/carboxypeptidase family protein